MLKKIEKGYLMRKGSFSVEKVTSFTIDHNTRKSKPRYLIGLENKENIYEEYYSYEEFEESARKRYQEVVKQRVQKNHKFFEEAVISLEEHHTIDDVENLFKELKKEFGGHTLINLAIHNDEGHFEKNEIEYYPTKHILKKDDGWYILDEDNLDQIADLEKPKNEDFKIKVDINDFKRVYNYHAHAVFSRFDLDLGRNARMQQKDMSHRIKFVSETLGMRYDPDNKTRHKKKSIGDFKQEKSTIRNEKLKLLKKIDFEKDKNQKLEQELEQIKQSQDKKNLAKQKDLKEEVNRLRTELQGQSAIREDYAKLEELNRDLKQLIKDKSLTVLDLKEKIKELENSILDDKKRLYDYEETFEKLDKVLLIEEDKKEGKDYLKLDEIVGRVSKLVQLVDKFKRAFNEFNQLLEKPKQTFNGIRLAVISKLKFGGEDKKDYINKIADKSKEINKKFSKDDNQGTKEKEDINTSSSKFTLKRKRKSTG